MSVPNSNMITVDSRQQTVDKYSNMEKQIYVREDQGMSVPNMITVDSRQQTVDKYSNMEEQIQ